GNRSRFLDCDSVRPKVGPSRLDVRDTQSEMSRADAVRLLFEQQMNVLIAQVIPDNDEIKSARARNLFEAQDTTVESSAALYVGDDHRAMIDGVNGEGHEGSSLNGKREIQPDSRVSCYYRR